MEHSLFAHHRNPKRDLPIRLALASERLAATHDPLARHAPNPYAPKVAAAPKLEPASLDTGNELRPLTLDQIVGQDDLKPLLRKLIANSRRLHRPLSHVLLIGGPGTGKTTISLVLARALGVRCFVLKPPIDMGTLLALRESAREGDVVFVDEIHMQVHGDRRGITQAVDPENLYHILEDRILMTPTGPVTFPHLTWIGATTDAGLLPQALVDRFPIQPHLAPYTEPQMLEIAHRNLAALKLSHAPGVAAMFAAACRLTPRQLNSYIETAQALAGQNITSADAHDVIVSLNGVSLDGLTGQMQTALRYLYLHCGRETKDGMRYSSSVNGLATAVGAGRDTRYVAIFVEPWLLQQGFLQVWAGTGRVLTDKGIARARELVA